MLLACADEVIERALTSAFGTFARCLLALNVSAFGGGPEAI
jgi:hypothetical protein